MSSRLNRGRPDTRPAKQIESAVIRLCFAARNLLTGVMRAELAGREVRIVGTVRYAFLPARGQRQFVPLVSLGADVNHSRTPQPVVGDNCRQNLKPRRCHSPDRRAWPSCRQRVALACVSRFGAESLCSPEEQFERRGSSIAKSVTVRTVVREADNVQPKDSSLNDPAGLRDMIRSCTIPQHVARDRRSRPACTLDRWQSLRAAACWR
jgi:hypothetical protein